MVDENIIRLITSTNYKDQLLGEYFYKKCCYKQRLLLMSEWMKAINEGDEDFKPNMSYETLDKLISLSYQELQTLKEMLKEEEIDVDGNVTD